LDRKLLFSLSYFRIAINQSLSPPCNRAISSEKEHPFCAGAAALDRAGAKQNGAGRSRAVKKY
jgi:hypothetical protein